jgi:hypothetical protein
VKDRNVIRLLMVGVRAASVFVVLGLMAACGAGSSSSSPTTPSAPASTTFQGTLAGLAGQSGTIDVTIQATIASLRESFPFSLVVTLNAQTPTATGTIRINQTAPVSVSGSWNSANNTVTLSGGGFTITGILAERNLTGTYTSVNGAGHFAALSTADGTVTRFCGTYLSDLPGYRETGIFNMQLTSDGRASVVSATVTPAPECCSFFTGRRDGNSITLMTPEQGSQTGTIDGQTFSGRVPHAGGFTSWTSTTSACQ